MFAVNGQAGVNRTWRHVAGWAAGGAILSLLAGCTGTSFVITPVSTREELTEKVVRRESLWATKKVALIDVDGVIRNRRAQSLLGTAGENPVSLFKEKLDQAEKDDAVKAVVLRINSPGGGVAATEMMYGELLAFRQRTRKPVVASLQDVAASGGYYLACGADQVYALPTSITGSIGVIMLAPDFAGTMNKIGMRMNVIKSGDMKDMGSIFREMSEKDRAVFQFLINSMYDRFLDVVVAARPAVPRDHLRALADGRVYLGADAKERGLIDQVGSFYDALAAAKKLAGLEEENVKVVQYGRQFEYRPNVYARGEPPVTQVNLLNIEVPDWIDAAAPELMYLWAPTW